MYDKLLYGVDLGSKKAWVSNGTDLGVPYSIEDFLAFKWYEGEGTLLTEITTFHARPLTKTPSLAQYFTYGEIEKFLAECQKRDIEVRVYPNKHTYKAVRTFMDLVEKGDPSVAKFSGIDFSSYKPDDKGKFKYDELEALVLSWVLENAPETTSLLTKIRNPDFEWERTYKLKHAVINESNRRLNHQRITGDYNGPDFAQLMDLLPSVEAEVMRSNHPGAEVLRNIEAFPLPRASRKSEKYGYDKGDIKAHEVTPALKAVWSCRVDANGEPYRFGLQMLKSTLGWSAFRFRSGVAGAQLRYDVSKEIRAFRVAEAGLPLLKGNDSYEMLTRDKQNPYFAVRMQTHKDLLNVVKFLNITFLKLLQ